MDMQSVRRWLKDMSRFSYTATVAAAELALAALSMGTASVPLTQLTAGQLLATAVGASPWPVMTTIANPIGLIFGIGVTAIAGMNYLRRRMDNNRAQTVQDGGSNPSLWIALVLT
jgi:hypothetical protein